MAPAEPGTDQSLLNVLTISPGEYSIHTNIYLRIKIEETNQAMTDSSIGRLNTFKTYPRPTTTKDVIKMLGDTSAEVHQVFRDRDDDFIRTIAIGIFDCKKRTWSLYSDNPRNNAPLAVLPLLVNDDK